MTAERQLLDEPNVIADQIAADAMQYLSDVNSGYMSVLRCIAKARRAAAADTEQTFDPEAGQPTPEQLESLEDPDADRLGRLMAMSRNVNEYRAFVAETPFLDHQVQPFMDILDCIDFGMPNNGEELREAVELVVGGAFAEMPPGYGKTLDIVFGCKAVGVGRPPAKNENARPIRALVLVPSRRVRDQTIGRKN